MVRRVIVGAFAALACAPVAAAQDSPLITYGVSDDGTAGRLTSYGQGTAIWEQCLPAQPCVLFDDGDDNPRTLYLGSQTPVGTTYRLYVDGRNETSVPWRGPVKATAAPRATGDVRVGGLVRPVGAVWEGGWDKENSRLQLQACPTQAGGGCRTIHDSLAYGYCEPDRSGRRIPARYEGWWLRVADERYGGDIAFPAIGYLSPESVVASKDGPLAITADAGRIGPGPAPADCGQAGLPPQDPPPVVTPPKPKGSIKTTVRRSRSGRYALGAVTCSKRCSVRVTVKQGKRTITLKRTLRKGTTSLALPRADARKLRSGRIAVRIRVDGTEIAVRSAKLVR